VQSTEFDIMLIICNTKFISLIPKKEIMESSVTKQVQQIFRRVFAFDMYINISAQKKRG
jgi:hypothetical protein